MAFRYQSEARHLVWEACYNTRDLGGLPTEDGGHTRWRSVIRSDLLNRLNQRGRFALTAYGVGTIIDLRGPDEVQREPSPFAGNQPVENNITYWNIPVEGSEPHVEALMDAASSHAEAYCLSLDYYADKYARVMRTTLDAPPTGVVLHCHAGKDRTGIVVALLQAQAGVPSEFIAGDYAVSQKRLWPFYEKLVAEAGGGEHLGLWLKPIATEETMHGMLKHLNTRYGGVRGYLITAGLSDRAVDRLPSRLR